MFFGDLCYYHLGKSGFSKMITESLFRFMTKQLLCVSAGMLLFGVATSHAQVTTSSINGTITDATTKETLIGASVVAKHLPTGTIYGAATNLKGNFIIQGLRPGGPYVLEVSYVGYQSIKLENITLSLGEAETFNVALRDDSRKLEDVVITAKKGNSLTANRTGAATSFNRKAIENTPSVSRSLFDIAKLTPQASGGSGGTSFAGSSNKYNSFQIDGAVNNDVFGLSSSGTNGGTSGTTPISLEAIEAVQVVIAPFDVRQSGFTGGGINAITKSGSNKFSGSVYDYYYNQDFIGTTAGKDVKERKKYAKEYNNTLGFTLGGPIVKDKLFFFVNGEYVDRVEPTVNYLSDPKSGITQSDADRVVAHLAKLGYNSPGYDGLEKPTRSYKALARLDWNINQAHRLTLRYSYVQGNKIAHSNSLSRLNFIDRAVKYNSQTHSFVTELNSRFTSSLSNEFRVGYTRIRDNREPNGKFPTVSIELNNNNRIDLGADAYATANQLDQDIFTLTDNLTLSLGNHTITAGTHNELFNMYNLFIRDNYGSYVYSSLSDFETLGTATPATPKEYNYSYSIESVTGTKRWGPRFTAAQLGFYLQDEWKVNDRLRLTYGLRADVPIFMDKPGVNEDFNKSAIAKEYGVQNNTMPKTRILWSPRVGFRYTLDESRRELIRGGVGIFTGRIPFVWISNSFSNSGIEYSRTRLQSKDFANHPDFAFSTDPNNQYWDKNAKKPYSEVDMVTEDFRYPQVLRANLAFETTLPGGIRATLEGMFTKNLNNLRYQNLMVKQNGKQLANGTADHRDLYEVIKTNATNPYTHLILLSNTDKGYAYNFTAQLSKDFSFGLSASLAYTYGKSMSSNDGNSSQAASGWRYTYSVNGGNVDEIGYSKHDLRHRIVGNLSYRVEYGAFATTLGLIYNGQNGSRYHYTYNGDINGDGYRDNDLVYIPTTAEVATMNFGSDAAKATAQRTALESYLSSRSELAGLRGQVMPRYSLVMPFTHQFDLHFAQDFNFKIAGRKQTIQLNADIINIGNLFNRAWGVNYFMSNNVSNLLGYNNGVYSFNEPSNPDMYTIADFDSRWRAQVGIKYIF